MSWRWSMAGSRFSPAQRMPRRGFLGSSRLLGLPLRLDRIDAGVIGQPNRSVGTAEVDSGSISHGLTERQNVDG